MINFRRIFNTLDPILAGWMSRHGHLFLRISLGIIFVWFGLLKSLGHSPVNDLVARTVYWFDPDVFIPILGWWEVLIGFFFLFHRLIRVAVFLLFLQIGGTFLPLVLLPEVCFQKFPFVLTMEGQYIVKNLLIISAAIVIGGTVHPSSESNRGMKG
ncbi:MAG: hypothetical protein A2787_04810 [Omnitrophica WOR_2 bacterium RIFCSPHIGHO2_01_FULL_48_9]|nr:MAG: hypothetical protein A3D10_03620 [Omnitrophica WOR_2 bacterium RIFCSPHIGHO2_02_FULL_48_11]OGX33240.1 MAG: hypothetical protein A2787_04810 [Omnitrophica WOR_2 bacterium RIFCSPHIGHO2_01_FULL_48_9]